MLYDDMHNNFTLRPSGREAVIDAILFTINHLLDLLCTSHSDSEYQGEICSDRRSYFMPSCLLLVVFFFFLSFFCIPSEDHGRFFRDKMMINADNFGGGGVVEEEEE